MAARSRRKADSTDSTSAEDASILERLPVDELEGVTPNRSIDVKKFNAILRAFNKRAADPTASLDGVSLYFYRTFPKINNALAVPPLPFTYIEKLTCVDEHGAVTPLPDDVQGYIRSRWGGGRYRVSLNDKGSEKNQLAQCAFNVDDADAPPILDPALLHLTDTETLNWCNRMVAAGVYQRTETGYALKTSELSAPAGSAADGTTRLLEKLVNQLQQGTQQPTQIMDLMSEGYKRLITDSAAARTNGGSENSSLIAAMMQQQNQMFQLMVGLITKPPAAPAPVAPAPAAGTNLETLKELLTIARMMRGGTPAAAPEPSWIEKAIDKLAPVAAPLLMRAMAGSGAPVAPAPAGVAAAPTAAAAAPGGRDFAADFANIVLNCQRLGHDGSAVAIAVEVQHGEQAYQQLRAYGKDNLLAALLQSPRAQEIQASGAAITQMLSEFVDYGNDEPADDEPEGATA